MFAVRLLQKKTLASILTFNLFVSSLFRLCDTKHDVLMNLCFFSRQSHELLYRSKCLHFIFIQKSTACIVFRKYLSFLQLLNFFFSDEKKSKNTLNKSHHRFKIFQIRVNVILYNSYVQYCLFVCSNKKLRRPLYR